MITGVCLGYLQYGHDMDVYGSYVMTADNYHEECLMVVVNKLYVADQKACAEEIVKRCRENLFQSGRFSYDQSVPNVLYVTMYASKWQAEKGKQIQSWRKVRRRFGTESFTIHILKTDQIVHSMDELVSIAGEFV